MFDAFGGTEIFLYNSILWKYFDIKCPLKFRTALLVLHPKQFKMSPVFVDELNLCLLSSCLCAKAVRLRSGITGCLHITDRLKVFVFPNTCLKVEQFWKQILCCFSFLQSLSSENIPAKNFLKCIVYQVI